MLIIKNKRNNDKKKIETILYDKFIFYNGSYEKNNNINNTYLEPVIKIYDNTNNTNYEIPIIYSNNTAYELANGNNNINIYGFVFDNESQYSLCIQESELNYDNLTQESSYYDNLIQNSFGYLDMDSK